MAFCYLQHSTSNIISTTAPFVKLPTNYNRRVLFALNSFYASHLNFEFVIALTSFFYFHIDNNTLWINDWITIDCHGLCVWKRWISLSVFHQTNYNKNLSSKIRLFETEFSKAIIILSVVNYNRPLIFMIMYIFGCCGHTEFINNKMALTNWSLVFI